MRAAFLIFPLLFVACRHKEEPSRAAEDGSAPESSLALLRQEARETLDANCAECHTRGLPTALPRALRVFDLSENDWSRQMSEDQLREAARRLREPTAPTRSETEVRPLRVSDAERARFDLFVAQEIEARRTAARPK